MSGKHSQGLALASGGHDRVGGISGRRISDRGAVFCLQQDKLLFPAPKTSRRDPSNGHSMVEGFRHQNECDGPSPRGWIPSVTASAKVILLFKGTVKWEDLVGNEVADLVGQVIGTEAIPGFLDQSVGHKRMP